MGTVMEPLLTCPKCGAPVRADAARCDACGARTVAEPPPPWRVRAVVGVVLALFVAAAIWGVGWVKGQWSSSPTAAGSSTTAPASRATTTPASPTRPAPSTTTPPPTSSLAVPNGSRLCDKGGDLRAYAGTPRTSCSFAITVRDAFVGAGGTGGAGSGGSRQVRAHSTVTDTTYTITCTGVDLVTCRGGNDAVIYLLP